MSQVGGAIGVGLAAVSFRTRWLAEGLGMYAAVLKAVPVISLAPLTVVWFGIEAGSKIATVTIATAPILYTFTLVGLRRADPNAQELMRSYAAGRIRDDAGDLSGLHRGRRRSGDGHQGNNQTH